MTFQADAGSADPQIVQALTGWANRQLDRNNLISQLRSARLLTAVAQRPAADEMSLLLFKSADGRTGLPAFTSLTALQQWQPTARPLPRLVRDLARDCLEHGYSALLVDLGQPHQAALVGIELTALAV